MSDLVACVSVKMNLFLSSLAIYVISPRSKNLAQAILNAILILRSSSDFVGWEVIFWRMSFVIGRDVDFTLANKVLPPLIIQGKQGLLNTKMEK